MESTQVDQGKKKTRLLIGIAVAVVVLLIIGGAMYAIISANKPKTAETITQTSTAPATVSQQDITDSTADLDAAVKKAQADHAAAETAVTNVTKQTKVSK